MKRLSWFFLFSIFAISCLDQPDCYQLNNNYLGVAFKIIGGGSDRVYLKSIESNGAHPDSLLKDPVVTNGASFTLNPYANEGTFTFEGEYVPADAFIPVLPFSMALNVTYLSRVQFVSEDCGERHVFTDLSVPSSDFDSVRILNNVPSNPATTNIELYRCPNTSLVYLDFVGDIIVKTISIQELEGGKIDVNATISSILLPLVQDRTTTTYDFVLADDTKKTLMLTYRTSLNNSFEDCGALTIIDRLVYQDNSSTVPGFTSVALKEDSIYDLPRINFEITP